MTERYTGGCQCGAVRYELAQASARTHYCHCRMCQRATGGPFAALTGVPRDKITWTKGTPKFFASSSLATRAFCTGCGTPLTFAYNEETWPNAWVYVTVGSLDDPTGLEMETHFGVESKLPWVTICDDLKQEITGGGISKPEDKAKFDAMQVFQS